MPGLTGRPTGHPTSKSVLQAGTNKQKTCGPSGTGLDRKKPVRLPITQTNNLIVDGWLYNGYHRTVGWWLWRGRTGKGKTGRLIHLRFMNPLRMGSTGGWCMAPDGEGRSHTDHERETDFCIACQRRVSSWLLLAINWIHTPGCRNGPFRASPNGKRRTIPPAQIYKDLFIIGANVGEDVPGGGERAFETSVPESESGFFHILPRQPVNLDQLPGRRIFRKKPGGGIMTCRVLATINHEACLCIQRRLPVREFFMEGAGWRKLFANSAHCPDAKYRESTLAPANSCTMTLGVGTSPKTTDFAEKNKTWG